jgi:hypothetical protein
LLRFLDVYDRMIGGRLVGSVRFDGPSQIGEVVLRNFTLEDEPALRGMVADVKSGRRVGSQTKFTKGRLRFDRTAKRIKLEEAVMWGDDIGGSIAGTIDYAGDRIDLSGSFVPAYALNNFFAQIPLIGTILGGEKHEGLFAVPFTITGKASRPRLTVNALSAAAPGIFRKILDFKNQSEAIKDNPEN